MSAGHSEASFNHSCLKVPVDSFSRKPFPNYERLSSAENSIKKGAQEKNSLFYDFNDNFKSVKSYLKFYESIPDYTELHHLSNEEFYSRLKTLKKTQKKFCSVTGALSGDVELFNEDLTENNSGESFDLDKETNEGGFYCTVCSLKKDYCHTSNSNKRTEARTKQSDPKMSINSDNENVSEFYEAEFKKHSDYEADRESSNLQVGEKPSNNTRNYFSMTNLGDECLSDKQRSKQLRNLRVSSGCEWDSPELCHRYLESNFRRKGYGNEFILSYGSLGKEKSLIKKPQQNLVRPIPLTSRIPLYDKLMLEKEMRRKIRHERYSEKLRSLVQPFSFTRREEENKRLRMARSNPELTVLQTPAVKFKAKPVPKNLFSNYVYERMREEDFYRALKKRVRAEEMLKASSLPPSMALREKKILSKSLDLIDYKTPEKIWDCGYGYRRACQSIRNCIEYDEKKKSELSKKKNLVWLLNKSRRINSTTDSSTEISPYESVMSETRRKTRPHSAFSSSSRSNLASVLRIETARKRMEKEMEDKLREIRLKDEARFKARLVRMSPEWRALNYDKEEDLALRLALRREEDRMRQEKHQKLMESIYGRVYSMPPLFHRERFTSGKKSKSQSPCKSNESDIVFAKPESDQINEEPCEGSQKAENDSNSLGLPAPAETLENSGSSQSAESLPDRDKSEKKVDENDDLSPAEA